MNISIKKDDGEVVYNVNEISDASKQNEARVIITKVGTLETLSEAINFASATHRANLEKILEDCDEAIMIEPVKEEVSEDTKDK
tara:strand:+ start:1175 stop:1426 length:252 start_codon:yes stop_codon:yes gene_type:complete